MMDRFLLRYGLNFCGCFIGAAFVNILTGDALASIGGLCVSALIALLFPEKQ